MTGSSICSFNAEVRMDDSEWHATENGDAQVYGWLDRDERLTITVLGGLRTFEVTVWALIEIFLHEMIHATNHRICERKVHYGELTMLQWLVDIDDEED